MKKGLSARTFVGSGSSSSNGGGAAIALGLLTQKTRKEYRKPRDPSRQYKYAATMRENCYTERKPKTYKRFSTI